MRPIKIALIASMTLFSAAPASAEGKLAPAQAVVDISAACDGAAYNVFERAPRAGELPYFSYAAGRCNQVFYEWARNQYNGARWVQDFKGGVRSNWRPAQPVEVQP